MKPGMSFRALRIGPAPREDVRHLILSAAKGLPRRIPGPARDLLGQSFRTKRESWQSGTMRALGITLLAALFFQPVGLLAQSAQPWTGRGIAAPQVARSDPAGASAGASQSAEVQAVAMVGFTVSDMDRSVEFYTRVLDFEKVSDDKVLGPAFEELHGILGVRLRVVRLRLGDEYLQLTEYLASRGRPVPLDSRSNDRWFQHVAIIVRDMDQAYARLRRFRVQHASTAPQLLPKTIPNAAGIRAFYFKDPDGHPLEILQFPPDKGDRKWHRPTSRLFLGIDHTAIVVKNTSTSLAFYRDVLGFRVAGESVNFGTEQEHLNNVPGARLHITALRASRGPGIEFLQYLAPTDGRAYPADARPNDLVHWQTTLLVPDTETAAAAVRRGSFRLLSPGPVELPNRALGFKSGVLVRDPDGHVVQLVES